MGVTATAASIVVSVRGLTKIFQAQTAVAELDFEVRENEFVSVVGPSGCGKSTTLRIVAGLEPATSGTVRVRGHEVRGPIPDAAMVFQSPVLLPWRRTIENVLFPAEMRGHPAAFHRERMGLELERIWSATTARRTRGIDGDPDSRWKLDSTGARSGPPRESEERSFRRSAV